MTVLLEMTDHQQSENDELMEPSSTSLPPTQAEIEQRQRAVTSMLDRLVAQEDVHFRHQARDEASLPVSEKLAIATDLYHRNPGVFLERFGRHLNWSEDCVNFRDMCSKDEVVRYFVKQLDTRLGRAQPGQPRRVAQHQVRTRRLNALRRLDREGDTEYLSAEHFSHPAMRHRDPILWESMIGTHLNESGRRKYLDREYGTFSGFLMDVVLRNQEAQDWQQARQEQKSEQYADADAEDSSDSDNSNHTENQNDDTSLEGLEREFVELMRLRFVNGQDKDFDYSTIDNDDTLDEDAQEDLDAEERYFDAD